ncbi:TetR family transcriptional regulator [Streptomyces abyssalis]|uniref:TetR family transcriptional regulator n=1 Tax=Streptomyces abyssalis TaxID=933944 RepID=A0A1E7JLB4_9ACTN|nr:TetR/AcrR family transcriptional regulator [Streptomyces abyssalis]OEU88444.1 TetR family transcriptional regulator [Streptomyces abyssalis]OEU89182.1 TetR family transcriptional regulator [Streptomyces abyssalis]
MTQAAELTPAARKILDAAAELFYGRGITAVGVDLIAKEAGVTKKTLYDRFGSKEALVAAYLGERDERWREWLTARVLSGDAGAGPCERILRTFDALEEWVRRENPRGCGFVNAAAELPDPRHPGRKVITGQKRWLRDFLRELAVEAGAADPGRLADELVLLHEGATVLGGLHVVAGPVAAARSMARGALVREGCQGGAGAQAQ